MEHAKEIIIQAVTTVDEMHAVEELQREVWGVSEREIVSFMMFIPTLAVGGVLLGAFDGAEMVGFSYGFIGHESGRVILHSDMLAVRENYRDHKLGYRLKLAQREHALQQGITRITWTFDPLQSRNAHLNFAKLGVTSSDYRLDFYGPSSSPLHAGGTDRLWLHWDLESARVQARLAGARPSAPDAPCLLCLAEDHAPLLNEKILQDLPEIIGLEIPLVAAQWQKTDLPRVMAWRQATRAAFTSALACGYVVEDFCRLPDCGVYVLRRRVSERYYPTVCFAPGTEL